MFFLLHVYGAKTGVNMDVQIHMVRLHMFCIPGICRGAPIHPVQSHQKPAGERSSGCHHWRGKKFSQ